eukprot:scaffold18795_cov129-Isochrysis_galbana.AAC.4
MHRRARAVNIPASARCGTSGTADARYDSRHRHASPLGGLGTALPILGGRARSSAHRASTAAAVRGGVLASAPAAGSAASQVAISGGMGTDPARDAPVAAAPPGAAPPVAAAQAG